MKRSLLKDEHSYRRKHWVSRKLKAGTWILRGTKRFDPLSGDTSISFDYLFVPTKQPYDPFQEEVDGHHRS